MPKKIVPPTTSPDTQRGIITVALLAAGLITAFSLFGLAGTVGEVINRLLTSAIGYGRFLIPIIFFILVYRLLYPTDHTIKPVDLVGLGLLASGIFGLLDIMQPHSAGVVGTAATYLFHQFSSSAVAVIIFCAMIVMAILIVFNTSLERLVQQIPATTIIGKVLRFVVALFSSAKQRLVIARERAAVATSQTVQTSTQADDEDDVVVFSHKTLTGQQPKTDTTEPEQMELIHVAKQHRKIDLPLDLLSNKRGQPTSGDINRNKDVIHKTLLNFDIAVEMGPVSVGPTVTQYTFKPASGVKVAQIVSLQNDLALALAAHPIRIEAPIPGKSLIGVEVPNVAAARVGLRELFEADNFKQRQSNLTLLLGRDVAGKSFTADLGAMPHLLIAGATGSGKSVCINTIILSLLYQNGPDDLKLVMVDPKRVEFTMYNDIPHLLTPVVTDVQKTINALKWCVNEMDRRYEVLSNAKKRDIAGYNASHPQASMPYIVFMIDELADLMASAPREVEAAIVRLAQMARAVGIHLVLATQRPSVDVITGLIKANITSRCAFNVASLIDSRTILDAAGAEKLLGRGDMLYVSAESSKPKRIQGAFVQEEEIMRVVNHLKSKGTAEYDDEVITVQSSSVMPQAWNDSSDEDTLLPDAKKIIVQAQKASASLLQRRLRVGYARAARLLDILEEQGFIGPADGAKPREILGQLDEADDTNFNDNEDDTNHDDTDRF
ncbi:MAG: DNA translocase FtsK 4TM domain-containing protein [Candidatus Kerfeldbacteria bacterium]|nr:DNA translocase FtsK 4TM domain-containing protein [Candidatus Kerfeldbacteria bacterium]